METYSLHFIVLNICQQRMTALIEPYQWPTTLIRTKKSSEMIHFLPIANYLQALQLFAIILRRRRQLIHRNNNANNMLFDLLQIMHLCEQNVFSWINLVHLVRQYLSLHRKNKRRLYKPHLLLKILAGYRYFNFVATLKNTHIFHNYCIWTLTTLHSVLFSQSNFTI